MKFQSSIYYTCSVYTTNEKSVSVWVDVTQKNGQSLELSATQFVEPRSFLFTGRWNTDQIRSVISVHSRSPLKPDKLTVLEIKAEHSDKVDSVLLFASYGRAKMMYETHTVQTGSYKFAWLVDWWEVGYWVGGGWVVTLKQRSERKRSLCTHFVFLKLLFIKRENILLVH